MHPDRKTIEKQIISGIPISTIARQYQLGRDALFSHRDRHLTPQLAGAATRSLKIHTEDLLNELLDLASTTKDILRTALEDGHRGLALKSVQQARNNIEVLTRFVLSMEEIRIKEDTIIVQEQESSAWLKEGFKKLSKQEQEQYINLVYRMVELTGGNYQDGDPDQDPDPAFRIDPDDSSIQEPVRPRRKEPGSGGPTRRINPPSKNNIL